MRNHLTLAIGLAALTALGCSDEDNDLDPGGSTIAGNVAEAATPGDTSVGGITVLVRGDGESSDVTATDGSFVVTSAPTGEVELVFRRGACEATFDIDSVSSQSNLDVVDAFFDCDVLGFAAVFESFESILREDGFSRSEPLTTCVRVGRNQRTRDVDAATATIRDDDDDVVAIDDLFAGDRVFVDGDRDPSGRAATFLASEVRVLESGADDPCDDL